MHISWPVSSWTHSKTQIRIILHSKYLTARASSNYGMQSFSPPPIIYTLSADCSCNSIDYLMSKVVSFGAVAGNSPTNRARDEQAEALTLESCFPWSWDLWPGSATVSNPNPAWSSLSTSDCFLNASKNRADHWKPRISSRFTLDFIASANCFQSSGRSLLPLIRDRGKFYVNFMIYFLKTICIDLSVF